MTYHRGSISELSIATTRQYVSFKRSSQPEREICPPPKPRPPPPPANDAMFWGAVTVLCVAGGFAIYAQRNPEARDWLSMHAPWFDDIIAVLFQENMTYQEFAIACVEDAKKRVVDFFDDTEDPCMAVRFGESGDLGEPCELIRPPVMTKDICEYERCLKDVGDSTIHNYMTARDACRYYNKVVPETLGSKYTFKDMKALRAVMDERIDLVKTSLENATSYRLKFDNLGRYLDCGGIVESKEIMDKTRKLLEEYKDKITTIHIEYQYDNDKSLAFDEQWMKLEKLMDVYTHEVSSIYPTVDYMDEKSQIVPGESVDFLLVHTLKYVRKLQADVYDTLDTMSSRTDRGLETLSQDEKVKQYRDREITSKYNQGKKKLNSVLSFPGKGERTIEIRKKIDEITKAAMKEQQKMHEQSFIQRAMEEEKKIMKNFDKMVVERVKAKTESLVQQKNELMIKMAIVNKRIEVKSNVAEETRRSQDLWAAAGSLLAATKRGEPFVDVSKELQALAKISGNKDKIVVAVLNAIPQSVWDDGLVPESVLREKYHTMESVALKVALVEDTGGPLTLYIFSLIQSLLLFFKVQTIPQQELDDPPKEPLKGYDTFDLLIRARFFINRGDIVSAVKYVSALEGASRGAANTWYEAARAHVETRQAAETVIAHAVAMGLKYV